jgi:hypothetical protein
MSAVPLPVLVLAGTSDAPLRVAFIFSAKAGPAKATVAPSVASVVLVDMVFSLFASFAVSVSRGSDDLKFSRWRISECRDEFSMMSCCQRN